MAQITSAADMTRHHEPEDPTDALARGECIWDTAPDDVLLCLKKALDVKSLYRLGCCSRSRAEFFKEDGEWQLRCCAEFGHHCGDFETVGSASATFPCWRVYYRHLSRKLLIASLETVVVPGSHPALRDVRDVGANPTWAWLSGSRKFAEFRQQVLANFKAEIVPMYAPADPALHPATLSRHPQLAATRVLRGPADLLGVDVLVLNSSMSTPLPEGAALWIKQWVAEGGTLLCKAAHPWVDPNGGWLLTLLDLDGVRAAPATYRSPRSRFSDAPRPGTSVNAMVPGCVVGGAHPEEPYVFQEFEFTAHTHTHANNASRGRTTSSASAHGAVSPPPAPREFPAGPFGVPDIWYDNCATCFRFTRVGEAAPPPGADRQLAARDPSEVQLKYVSLVGEEYPAVIYSPRQQDQKGQVFVCSNAVAFLDRDVFRPAGGGRNPFSGYADLNMPLFLNLVSSAVKRARPSADALGGSARLAQGDRGEQEVRAQLVAAAERARSAQGVADIAGGGGEGGAGAALRRPSNCRIG